MSVLIRGMEMPTSCYECPCNKDDGFGFFTCGVTKSECDFRNLPPDCPLAPVPPHGRLIDADALLKPKNQHIDVFADEWYVTVRTIETAPTIIEAEEGEI